MYTFLQGDRNLIKLMVPSQQWDGEFKDTSAQPQQNRVEYGPPGSTVTVSHEK